MHGHLWVELEVLRRRMSGSLSTFDGLLGEKVVLCSFNLFIQLGDLFSNGGKILEYKTSRSVGELSTELSNVMAERAANVHEQSCVLLYPCWRGELMMSVGSLHPSSFVSLFSYLELVVLVSGGKE